MLGKECRPVIQSSVRILNVQRSILFVNCKGRRERGGFEEAAKDLCFGLHALLAFSRFPLVRVWASTSDVHCSYFYPHSFSY